MNDIDRQANEEQFLESYDPSKFEHPSVTVDVALVSVSENKLRVLLLKRQEHPSKDRWALPGGFVRSNESLDQAAARVLEEKTGLRNFFLEQLYTFGEPKRDPRTRVITVAYYALVDHDKLKSDLATLVVPWEGETGGPVTIIDDRKEELPLAFDHGEILGMVVKRLRGKLNYAPIGFQLLPARFTLRNLQDIHETVLGRSMNKDSFRRRMLASGQLLPTGEREIQVGHRPAELYRFITGSAV